MLTLQPLKTAKLVGLLVVLVVFGFMAAAIQRWSEHRNIGDDVCYFRQAHLFQLYGLDGINTDLSRDNGFLAARLKHVTDPTWNDPKSPPCHRLVEKTGKVVMQYPPGTGAVLSLFPEGGQLIALYLSVAAFLLCAFSATILRAKNISTVALATVVGGVSLYLTNNPMKSSFSLAPTIVICLLAGWLSAIIFTPGPSRNRRAAILALGLALGLSVNFRIANALFVPAYGAFFLWDYLRSRRPTAFLDGALFAATFAIGVAPTLVANFVNAGGAFSTPYASHDASPPDFALTSMISQAKLYLEGTQGFLIVTAIGCAIYYSRISRLIAAVALITITINLLYYLSHPIFTPYYAVPSMLLAIWTIFIAGVPGGSARHQAHGSTELSPSAKDPAA